MIWLAAFLAVLAFVLAVPLPRLLSRAQWRVRSPWTTMLLWQSVALAGGLALIGAPLVYGLLPFGESVPEALSTVFGLASTADGGALAQHHITAWHIFSLCAALLLAVHLLLTLLRTSARTMAARRRHRDLVRLLSSPRAQSGPDHTGYPADPRVDHQPHRSPEHTEARPARHPGALIIEHETPLAYCLPGITAARSVTVLSRGMIEAVGEQDLEAVVAHEHTHLAQRHHLLTMAFEAWYRALPWLPTTRYGREAVLELTEMLADDGALRDHSREALIRALALSSGTGASRSRELGPAQRQDTGSQTPGDDLSTAHSDDLDVTAARLRRLLQAPGPMPWAQRAGIITGALALLLVPTLLLVLV